MYAIGILGIRYLKFVDAQQEGLFRTVVFFLVSYPHFSSPPSSLTVRFQLNSLGWSVILVNSFVRDLREKKGVSPIFRFIGWALFRTSSGLSAPL